MKLIRINGLNTSYYSGGTGKRDVLLLHGWASSGRMWLRTMWALRHNYRLWALDLPGFGDSEAPHIDWYSIDRYTDHVAAFCAEMGIEPFAVIGHSMGGRITLDIGRRYPHLAKRLVAISATITGKLGLNLDIFMMGIMGDRVREWSRHVWPLAAATVMTEYWAPKYLGSAAMRRTTEDLRRSNHQAVIESLRAVVRQDFSPHLNEIEHPTLVIVGKRDYTVPPKDSILAARKIPRAQLIELDDIHHQPTDECHDTYLYAIEAFLSDIPIQLPPRQKVQKPIFEAWQ